MTKAEIKAYLETTVIKFIAATTIKCMAGQNITFISETCVNELNDVLLEASELPECAGLNIMGTISSIENSSVLCGRDTWIGMGIDRLAPVVHGARNQLVNFLNTIIAVL